MSCKKMGSTKKYYRTKQPYWNDLNELCSKLCSAERTFLKCGLGEPWKRRALHSEFKQCQVEL